MNIQVGLNSWIIEDGNYPDFQVGQEARFALEFLGRLKPSSSSSAPNLNHQQGAVHVANGLVVFAHPEVWVCDFGILAFSTQESSDSNKVGARMSGEIYLGVDPYFYKDSLHALPELPELRYAFRIERIWIDTTPWVAGTDEHGRRFISRDPNAKRTFREVSDTRARLEGMGSAEYVLDCHLLLAAV